MSIKIEYNGSYPNLCSGDLIVTIDDKEWIFPDYCLVSGGMVSFNEDWEATVTSGPWGVTEWPTDFPENLKDDVLEAVNDNIEWGCCGGCV